jgi:hypothetical protein
MRRSTRGNLSVTYPASSRVGIFALHELSPAHAGMQIGAITPLLEWFLFLQTNTWERLFYVILSSVVQIDAGSNNLV